MSAENKTKLVINIVYAVLMMLMIKLCVFLGGLVNTIDVSYQYWLGIIFLSACGLTALFEAFRGLINIGIIVRDSLEGTP